MSMTTVFIVLPCGGQDPPQLGGIQIRAADGKVDLLKGPGPH